MKLWAAIHISPIPSLLTWDIEVAMLPACIVGLLPGSNEIMCENVLRTVSCAVQSFVAIEKSNLAAVAYECVSQTHWPQGVLGKVGWNLLIVVEDCERFKGLLGGRMLWDTWLKLKYWVYCISHTALLSRKWWHTQTFWESEVYWRKCRPKQGNPWESHGERLGWVDVDSVIPVHCEWSLLGSGPFGYSALGARMGEELPSETRALFLLRSQLYLNVS